jgi:hypothetical protein
VFENLNFTYPTALELQEIQRIFQPQYVAEDPIFQYFPIVTKNSWRLKWRQRDNFIGLQNVRGLGGEFQVVNKVGAKEYDMEPSVYGEALYWGEEELTEKAQMASLTEPTSINDEVTEGVQQLEFRQTMRIRHTLWTMVGTGAVRVTDKTGAVKAEYQYPFSQVNAAVAWSNRASATPFADLVGLRKRAAGIGATFGKGSKVFINAIDFEHLTLNANPADVFGRRTQYGATINNIADVNKLLKEQNSGEDDLPEIAVWDGGHYSNATTFQRHIPTGTAIVLGKRLDGSPLGEYRVCRNMNNPEGAAGFYQRFRDLREQRSPPAFELEQGHNGGPVVWYTQPIARLNIG